MAIAFDNASTAGAVATVTVKWTHTATGSNLFAVMGTASGAGFSLSTTGINNLPFSIKASVLGDGAGIGTYQLAVASAVAAGNLSMSASFSGTSPSWCCAVATYTGVAQANPVGAASSATATGTVLNLSVSSTAGATVVAMIATTQQVTITDPQNARAVAQYNDAVAGFSATVQLSDKASGGSTTSFSWSLASALNCFMAGIAISATAIAATNNLGTLALTKVGV